MQLAEETRELTRSQILCEALIREGVNLMYGYSTLPHVLVRHEQAATRATGKVGVCVVSQLPKMVDHLDNSILVPLVQPACRLYFQRVISSGVAPQVN